MLGLDHGQRHSPSELRAPALQPRAKRPPARKSISTSQGQLSAQADAAHASLRRRRSRTSSPKRWGFRRRRSMSGIQSGSATHHPEAHLRRRDLGALGGLSGVLSNHLYNRQVEQFLPGNTPAAKGLTRSSRARRTTTGPCSTNSRSRWTRTPRTARSRRKEGGLRQLAQRLMPACNPCIGGEGVSIVGEGGLPSTRRQLVNTGDLEWRWRRTSTMAPLLKGRPARGFGDQPYPAARRRPRKRAAAGLSRGTLPQHPTGPRRGDG